LIVWISEDYNHNQYFQAWASQHLGGGLGFLLNGTLAAFYAGILIAVSLNRPLPPSRRERVRRREQVLAEAETRGPMYTGDNRDFVEGGEQENQPPGGVTD
jgi:hypothetical protein